MEAKEPIGERSDDPRWIKALVCPVCEQHISRHDVLHVRLRSDNWICVEHDRSFSAPIEADALLVPEGDAALVLGEHEIHVALRDGRLVNVPRGATER